MAYNDSMCPSIITAGYGPKPLLSGSIPLGKQKKSYTTIRGEALFFLFTPTATWLPENK